MNFGLEKCKKATIKRGKLSQSDNITLPNNDVIQSLSHEDTYKYLGIFQNDTNKTTRMKTALRNEYFARIKKIMKTRLNAKNTIDAINTFAIPALSYGYVVLDWSITELETIDRETRKLLKKYHLLHENSDITRLYLTRKLGGRGLTNVTDQYKNQVIQYSCYLRNTGDILLNLVSTWQTTRRAKSIHERANSYCDQLQLDVNEIATKTKEQRKNEIKTKRNTQKRNELKTKEMHGQYVKLLDEAHIDTIN